MCACAFVKLSFIHILLLSLLVHLEPLLVVIPFDFWDIV